MKGKEMKVSLSMGVALYPQDEIDSYTLLKKADQAMYFAKKQGKNNCYFLKISNSNPTMQYLSDFYWDRGVFPQDFLLFSLLPSKFLLNPPSNLCIPREYKHLF